MWPEVHVVETREHARVHVVQPARRDLGVAELGRHCPGRHELVRHGNVTHAPVERARSHHHAQGIRVIRDVLVGEEVAHGRRPHEGDGPDAHGAIVVGKLDGPDGAVIHRRHVDSLPGQHRPRVGHALRRVVVAGNHDGGHARLRRLGEEPVDEGHGLGAGRGLVVQVPRDEQGVRLVCAKHVDDLGQDVPLVLEHRKLADALAYVQVRDVQQSHTLAPSSWRPSRPPCRCHDSTGLSGHLINLVSPAAAQRPKRRLQGKVRSL